MKAEAGIYWGKLKAVDVGATGKNKTPRLRMTFSMGLKATLNNEWGKIEPFERSIDLFLTDKALKWTEEKLEILGFDGNYSNPSVQGFDLDLSEKGTQLTCEIKGDEKPYEEWALTKLAESYSADMDPLPGSDLDRLEARFKQSQDLTKTPKTPPGAPASDGTEQSGSPEGPEAPPEQPLPGDSEDESPE